MLNDLLPFPFKIEIDTVAIAGTGLWALALYLGFFPIAEWVAAKLTLWFNFAERSLYTSEQEFERTRKGREAQNAFYASILSIIPFLIAGGLCNYGLNWGLDQSWAISLGVLSCMGCGIYELGRRDGQAAKK